MAIHPALAKLRAANISPITYNTTLEKEGYAELAERIKADNLTSGGVLTSFYFQAVDDSPAACMRAYLIAHLFSREVVLNTKTPLISCEYVGLFREYRIAYNMNREIEPMVKVIERKGDGYITVPDFHIDTRADDGRSPHDRNEVIAFLMGHVYAGGGLALAGMEPSAAAHAKFGPDLCDLIERRFTTIITSK